MPEVGRPRLPPLPALVVPGSRGRRVPDWRRPPPPPPTAERFGVRLIVELTKTTASRSRGELLATATELLSKQFGSGAAGKGAPARIVGTMPVQVEELFPGALEQAAHAGDPLGLHRFFVVTLPVSRGQVGATAWDIAYALRSLPQVKSTSYESFSGGYMPMSGWGSRREAAGRHGLASAPDPDPRKRRCAPSAGRPPRRRGHPDRAHRHRLAPASAVAGRQHRLLARVQHDRSAAVAASARCDRPQVLA